jgi:uncharacterized protein (TIGR03067 family)
MRCTEANHRPVFRISGFVFAAGLLLLVAGAGRALQARPPADEDARRSSPTADDQAGSDREKMQGKWKIVRCEFSGRDDPQPVGVEDTITGEKWLRPGRRTGEYRLKLDPSKDPKQVELSADRLGDETLKGIYLLEGDKLTICYAYDPSSPRPTGFKTDDDSRVYLYVLERVKKE